MNLSAGFFEAQPDGDSHNNYDDWYSEGRYAIGAGYYWTENFKTEIEFATTGEGSRYVQDFGTFPARRSSIHTATSRFIAFSKHRCARCGSSARTRGCIRM